MPRHEHDGNGKGKRKRLTLEDVRELTLIDRNNLDSECVNYAQILYSIGVEFAYAVSERDEAKKLVDEAHAEASMKYRERAERDSVKMTEARIEQKIKMNRTYVRAFEKYLAKKLDADMWGVARDSFAAKSRMLSETCSLFLAGYFGDKIIKSSNSAEVGHTEIRRKLNEGRKRNRD